MLANHQRAASVPTPYYQDSPPLSPISRSPQKPRRPAISINMHPMYKPGTVMEKVANLAKPSKRAQSDLPHISDPTLVGEAPTIRWGPLGTGAVIVSTPQEALSVPPADRPAVHIANPYKSTPASASAPSRINVHYPRQPAPVQEENSELPQPPASPALPPIPSSSGEHTQLEHPRRSAGSSSSGSSRGRIHKLRALEPRPPAPSRQLPMTPDASPHLGDRASLNAQRASTGSSSASSESVQTPASENFSGVPLFPVELTMATPQAPFEAVLMSSLFSNINNAKTSSVLVTLETSTSTSKTTLKTLMSRPSHLSTYLEELVSSTSAPAQTPAVSELASVPTNYTESVYSERSEFHDSDVDDDPDAAFESLFKDHITSAGVLKPRHAKRKADETSSIHIFLDRPSAPYDHIIAYLRTPTPPNAPGTLPYAARLFPAGRHHSFSLTRLEALLALRDEAAFLGLTDLQSLCDTELLNAQTPFAGTVPTANRESAHSTHTLCEPDTQATTEVSTVVIHKVEDAHVRKHVHAHSVDVPVILPTLDEGQQSKERLGNFPSDVVPPKPKAKGNALGLRQKSPSPAREPAPLGHFGSNYL